MSTFQSIPWPSSKIILTKYCHRKGVAYFQLQNTIFAPKVRCKSPRLSCESASEYLNIFLVQHFIDILFVPSAATSESQSFLTLNYVQNGIKSG